MSNEALEHAFAVVLAGGSGTRLWPKSRDNTPKQFLKLGGKRTMMQGAVDRILPLIPWERVIIVTNAKYVEAVRAQLPEIPAENIVAEPDKRDTALAMALGSMIARSRDPEAVAVNIASDHVLLNDDEYRRVVTASVELASKKEHLVTVGITPSGPNVNFGYIEVGADLLEVTGYTARKVKSFKEKPDRASAEGFLASGRYYWNANMYTWHVDTIMEAFAKYMPAALSGLQKIEKAVGTASFESVLADVYKKAEKVPIDIAISEKADNLVLFAGDFGWDDIGLWSTVYSLGEKDEHGTVVVSDSDDTSTVIQLESKNNLVGTNDRLVALIGIEDLVVIDSKDVLLVVPRERAADVKKVVQELKDRDLEDYL